MVREHFGLVFDDGGEVRFEGGRDALVDLPALTAKHRLVRRVLDQGVLEDVGRVRWRPAPEYDVRVAQYLEQVLQLRALERRYCFRQGIRELPPDRRTDLRDLLRALEPVESAISESCSVAGMVRGVSALLIT
jgi:hypothetical protein